MSAAQHDAGRSHRWGMDTRIQRPDHTLLQSIWEKRGERRRKLKKKKENRTLCVNSYFFLSFFSTQTCEQSNWTMVSCSHLLLIPVSCCPSLECDCLPLFPSALWPCIPALWHASGVPAMFSDASEDWLPIFDLMFWLSLGKVVNIQQRKTGQCFTH